MGNTNGSKKGNGITYRASNPPNRNGNGDSWANYGNVFMDSGGQFGTLYLDVTVDQLKALIATADGEGAVKVKVGLRRPKAKRQGAGPQEKSAAPAA
jgi:hypothetical protein